MMVHIAGRTGHDRWVQGFHAGLEAAAQHHESVNPASDAERLNDVPGAGAMGAIIEYRDGIRKLEPPR